MNEFNLWDKFIKWKNEFIIIWKKFDWDWLVYLIPDLDKWWCEFIWVDYEYLRKYK